MPYVIDDRFARGWSAATGPSGILDDVWSTSRGSVRPALSLRRLAACSQAHMTLPDPVQLAAVDDAGRCRGGSGSRRTGCCRVGPPGRRPSRTTSGRWWCSSHARVGTSIRRAAARTSARRSWPPMGDRADRHVRSPGRRPGPGRPCPTIASRSARDRSCDVLLGAEVMQGVARTARLLGAEGDELDRQVRPLGRGHPGQLEHARRPRRRCPRRRARPAPCPGARRPRRAGDAASNPAGSAITFSRGAGANRHAPRVAGGDPDGGPPGLVAEPGEPIVDQIRRLERSCGKSPPADRCRRPAGGCRTARHRRRTSAPDEMWVLASVSNLVSVLVLGWGCSWSVKPSAWPWRASSSWALAGGRVAPAQAHSRGDDARLGAPDEARDGAHVIGISSNRTIRETQVHTPRGAKHIARGIGFREPLGHGAVAAHLAGCQIAQSHLVPDRDVLRDEAADADLDIVGGANCQQIHWRERRLHRVQPKTSSCLVRLAACRAGKHARREEGARQRVAPPEQRGDAGSCDADRCTSARQRFHRLIRPTRTESGCRPEIAGFIISNSYMS